MRWYLLLSCLSLQLSSALRLETVSLAFSSGNTTCQPARLQLTTEQKLRQQIVFTGCFVLDRFKQGQMNSQLAHVSLKKQQCKTPGSSGSNHYECFSHCEQSKCHLWDIVVAKQKPLHLDRYIWTQQLLNTNSFLLNVLVVVFWFIHPLKAGKQVLCYWRSSRSEKQLQYFLFAWASGDGD